MLPEVAGTGAGTNGSLCKPFCQLGNAPENLVSVTSSKEKAAPDPRFGQYSSSEVYRVYKVYRRKEKSC